MINCLFVFKVQNLPARYQLDQPANMNYQSMAPYPQSNVSPARNNLPPSMYPSPPNKLSRQNPNNNLRIQYSEWIRIEIKFKNRIKENKVLVTMS